MLILEYKIPLNIQIIQESLPLKIAIQFNNKGDR